MRKLPAQIVGNIGLFYACYHLSLRGWNAMPTSRNARGIDIICFSMDGKRTLSIQVKSLSKRSPVPLGNDLNKVMADFWIIVNDAVSEKPNAFILLPHEGESSRTPWGKGRTRLILASAKEVCGGSFL